MQKSDWTNYSSFLLWSGKVFHQLEGIVNNQLILEKASQVPWPGY